MNKILPIILVVLFSANVFAENPKVNMYVMDKTEQADDEFSSGTYILCAQGYMFLSQGYLDGKAVVQMRDENGKFMKCPLYKKK